MASMLIADQLDIPSLLNEIEDLSMTIAIDQTISYSHAPFVTGDYFVVAQNDTGICFSFIESHPKFIKESLQIIFPQSELINNWTNNAKAHQIVEEIKRTGNPPTSLHSLVGTTFQKKVWSALQAIPVGTTKTYKEIADELGMKNGARAVGRACASNPYAVIVPCHRVIATNGHLRGYRWGLDQKRRLLEWEADFAKRST
jgi:O-6-methylguanine DNA methyltransferase